MSFHSDTLSWFEDNQSLLLILNAACLEKRQIPMLFTIVFDLTQPGFEPMIYLTLTLTITTLMQLIYQSWKLYKQIYSHQF